MVPAAKKKALAGEKSLEFFLLLLCPPNPKAPTAVFEPFSAAGIFHNAVQRHILGNNDFSHGVLLLSFVDTMVLAMCQCAMSIRGSRRERPRNHCFSKSIRESGSEHIP